MAVFGVPIFLGAFLFFWVQPLLGRYVLPWFGGVPAVWSACLLFFQTVLLAGYAWAHWLQRFPVRKQVVAQGLLGIAAFLFLPLIPAAEWSRDPSGSPAFRIFLLLATVAGLPCLALAATSTLVQSWFATARPGRSPYRLYALSNAASLGALLLAPSVLDAGFSRSEQSGIWAGLFVVYVAATVWAGRQAARVNGGAAAVAEGDARGAAKSLTSGPAWLWLALPFCSSLLLLSFTNQLSQEISVVPFLWTLPLAVYLLTFILAFDHPRWYPRRLVGRSLPVVLVLVWFVMFFSRVPGGPGVLTQSLVLVAGLFACCLFCHAELHRLRPPSDELSRFYLCVSTGGALGGGFVSLLAPRLFDGYLELGLGLILCGCLAATLYLRENPARIARPASFRMAGYVVGGLPLLVLMWAAYWNSETIRAVAVDRNFFGVCSVRHKDVGEERNFQRVFMHGATIHGMQFDSADRRLEPTTYFGRSSGVGRALTALRARGPLRIGVVGLGIGTLAVYAEAGDLLRCYEVNPLAVRMAREQFTYLADCPAKVEVLTGDARVLMAREPEQRLDVLILDAFNSGSIPVHLLTREAFDVWRRQLKPGGVIVVQATNKFLDLRPVLRGVTERLGWSARFYSERFSKRERETTGWRGSDWCVLSPDPAFFTAAELSKGENLPARRMLWTDERVDLLGLLK